MCHHQFVVEFVGIVPGRLAVVMRFMPNGSLQGLLYEAPPGDPQEAGPERSREVGLANGSNGSAVAAVVSGLPLVYGSLAREAVVVRMALEAALG